MRHNIDHRKLGRTTEHRTAMLRNQAISLIKNDRIKTTLPKAKELKRFVEKLITLAKRDTLQARRLAARDIQDFEALKKLFGTVAPLNSQRQGGYTKIVRYGFRIGDGAEEAIIELVGREKKFEDKTKKKAKKAEKAVEKKEEETTEKVSKEAEAKETPAPVEPETKGEENPPMAEEEKVDEPKKEGEE